MCVIVTGGGVKCWGRNNYGQLGIGETYQQPRNIPMDVSLGSGACPGLEVHVVAASAVVRSCNVFSL
jgi:hypothetical protein